MKSSLLFVCFCFFNCSLIGQSSYEVDVNNKVDKPQEALTPEKKFVLENFPFVNMADWKAGMRFIVETDKNGFALPMRLSKYKKSDSQNSGISQIEFQGKIFTYLGLEERKVPCMRGKCTRTYVLFDCNSEKYEYEYIGDIEELRKSQSKYYTSIDKLVYVDEIDKARELLLNKRLYFKEAPFIFHNKFIPVTILKIGIGSSYLGPVKIVYSDEAGKEYSVDIKLSGINSNTSSIGNQFYDIFSYENPRNKYSHISDEIWQVIQSRKVRIGMTKEECTLSWGSPSRINTSINSSEKTEQWVYSNRSYLYFKDGSLTNIQN